MRAGLAVPPRRPWQVDLTVRAGPAPRATGGRATPDARSRLADPPGDRPRHARGDLHLRSGRQRPRAVLGPGAGGVAADRRGLRARAGRARPRPAPRRGLTRPVSARITKGSAADIGALEPLWVEVH